ncbi:hypothetical protein GW17_00023531 [Ensete ventricosum]|nr:hypothetical protein GW17_00023531 [Ensete ventricosum]
MGNKIGRRRQVVDDKYTKPQGLYQHPDIDQKKLRKLILESKLAPCYPGTEECALDLEECPICFLYYPSLNRSRCCMKGICTECFLQMKPPDATRPTQCPFCKTSNYAVEYRGVKTKEEKSMEEVVSISVCTTFACLLTCEMGLSFQKFCMNAGRAESHRSTNKDSATRNARRSKKDEENTRY